MRRPTPQQAAAIERRTGPLLLEATAGSGKTSVLVARFVSMVREDGIAPRDILAITFTDKAAGELRERVRRSLVELGEREAARDTEAASISTIHAFCAALLRANPVAAGLDPGFTVLDESGARELRAEAFDAAMAAWLAGGDERAHAALELAAAWGYDRLARGILGLHEERRSAGEAEPGVPVPAPVPAPDPAPLRAACAAASAALGAEADPGATVLRALAAIEACGALLGADGLPPLPRLASHAVRPGSTKALQHPAVERYVEAHEAYRAGLAEHLAAGQLALLADLLARHGECYAALKRERGVVDFGDLELRARDLLAGRPGLRRAVRDRYARVMVDEFQDTNPLQVELLDLVAPEHLFVVGDELQSIYGFRHADVAGFRARRERLAEHGAVARLTSNFRSRAAILETVNAAFGPALGDGFTPLVAGRDDAGRPGDDPPVELLLTESEGWDELEERLGDTLPPVALAKRAEARLVAQRVRDLVDHEGVAPQDVVVLVRATGSLGALERALEDQGLLTYASGGRGYWSHQQVRDLLAWLQALANPREEAALYGVLASPLVGVGADTLAHLAAAGRELEWGVWRVLAAAFGAEGHRDDEPLAPPSGDAQGVLFGPGEPAPAALRDTLAPADRERLAAFVPRFARERRLAPRLGLDALLERVIAATGYDLHVLALPGGARRMANVHKLLRLAAAHEAAHGRDLHGFLAFAAAEEEAGDREPEAPIELGDLRAVRLMTIHAAKGLEFPVVVLADLGRQPRGEHPDIVVRDGVAGVRVVGFEGSGARTAALERLIEDAQRRGMAEERRVLYVGATRAMERLIVSGAMRLDKPPSPDSPVAPPLAWVAPALVPDLAARLAGAADQLAEHEAGGHRARVRLLRSTPATVGEVLREGALAPIPPTSSPAASLPPSGIAPVGPRAPAPAPPPAAISYSALARHGECGYRFYLERVLGLDEVEAPAAPDRREGGFDPRLRGTVVHALLERLDYARPAPVDPEAVAGPDGRPLPREHAEEAAALVAAFADSPLRERLAAAPTVHRERPFALALGKETLLTGVVDALATESGDRAVVVDFKTDRLAPGADLEALVQRGYATQRRAYALAALREGHAEVEVAHAFLEAPDRPVTARFAQADAAALERELLAQATPLLRGEYPLTDEPGRGLCATCPGRGGLCAYPPERTLA